MAIPDATTVAQRWATGAANAATKYGEGVQNTDKDPTALAIQAGQRYIQRVQESFQNGKWANGLRRSGKAGWQQAVLTKGVNNFASGVQASQQKFAERIAPVLAFEQNLLNQINSMPNITDADREARMLAWVRGMRGFTG
jgi:hypothetical protein